MKQLILLATLILLFNPLLQAQLLGTILKGKVSDKETKEGLAFVSVGIEGTYIGAATNMDGFFELKIPQEHLTKNLYLSAIGYTNISYPISVFQENNNILIELIPHTFSIEEVEVAAESMVLQRILRTVSENISKNYNARPMTMKLYCEKRFSADNAASVSDQLIFEIHDSKGYSNPSWSDAYKNRALRITEEKRNLPAESFREADYGLDELLDFDIVRLANTILNPKLLNDYELHLESKTEYNNDSVWIISYESNKLELAQTGSYYPASFHGKIYITMNDYAVLRNEIHLKETKANPQGRSLAVKSNAILQVQMNVTTGYKKFQGKYVLASIDTEKQYRSVTNQSFYESRKATVLEIQTEKPAQFSGRQYYSEAKINENFWLNFKVPLF